MDNFDIAVFICSGAEPILRGWIASKKLQPYRITVSNETKIGHAFFDVAKTHDSDLEKNIEDFVGSFTNFSLEKELTARIDVAVNFYSDQAMKSILVTSNLMKKLTNLGVDLNFSIYPTEKPEIKEP